MRTWRRIRRMLRRLRLWPRAKRSIRQRQVRRWAITRMGASVYVVEYESRDYSVTVLIPGLDQAQRARLRRAIRNNRAEVEQRRAWLAHRYERPVIDAIVPTHPHNRTKLH